MLHKLVFALLRYSTAGAYFLYPLEIGSLHFSPRVFFLIIHSIPFWFSAHTNEISTFKEWNIRARANATLLGFPNND